MAQLFSLGVMARNFSASLLFDYHYEITSHIQLRLLYLHLHSSAVQSSRKASAVAALNGL